MGCKFGKHNYWYSQGTFRCKKCGHVTYKSHRRKKNNSIILIPIIIAIAITGYFVYQTYGTSQSLQNEANKIIQNTSSTIQQISSQSQQSISNLQNSVTSSNHVPIAVYDNCKSFIRTDFTNTNMNTIDTTCNLPNLGGKHFEFNIPNELKNALQGSALGFVNTKVYQYGTNDFKIGLFDQVGEKNYTVTLWQLPQ